MEQKFTETYTIDFDGIGEVDCMVTGFYTRGVRASGDYGPPENYDPGSASEVVVTEIIANGHNLTSYLDGDKIFKLEEDLCYKFDCQDKF